MQINFYMGDNDRKLFHEYIFSRGGYLTPATWESIEIPIANSENPIDINYWDLKIFKEDNFSRENFNSEDWITKYLKSNASINCWVVGHTNSDGSFELNSKLSRERATAIKNTFKKNII